MLLLEITSAATSSSPDVWGELAKLGFAAVLMGLAIGWLVNQLKLKDKIIKAKDIFIEKLTKEKDDKLEKANEYIRENDKDNLVVLTGLDSTLGEIINTQKSLSDKAIDHQKSNTESLGKEIKGLKEILEIKINNITDKLDGK